VIPGVLEAANVVAGAAHAAARSAAREITTLRNRRVKRVLLVLVGVVIAAAC
jgi:hypothetical protein